MKISKIAIKNFKSFEDVTVKLDNFNVFIGQNASGKTNFIQVLKFLRDIKSHGLENAVSMQGGGKFLTNVNGKEKILEISIVWEELNDNSILLSKTDIEVAMQPTSIEYTFSLDLSKDKKIEIIKDVVKSKVNFYSSKDNSFLCTKELSIEKDFDKKEIIFNKVKLPSNKFYYTEKLFPKFFKEIFFEKLLIETPFFAPFTMENLLDFKVYDFDPKLPKAAITFTGKQGLEENGSNLAITLENFFKKKANTDKFHKVMSRLLPFIEKFETEKFLDKYSTVQIKEKFSKKPFPAYLMSDGTMIITLIITAILTNKGLMVLEEPERNIHPSLLSTLIEIINEETKKQQVIITTHNPLILGSTNAENVFFVKRNEDGNSEIFKPSDIDEIKVFLNNNIGIDRLYLDNLLEKYIKK